LYVNKLTQILLFSAIFCACSQPATRETQNNAANLNSDSTYTIETNLNPIGGTPNFPPGTLTLQPTDQKLFWNAVIKPILSGNKEAVLKTIWFPLEGDWTTMMQLSKTPDEATKEDFADIYSKFFNQDFVNAISAQTYTDVTGFKYNDTIVYSLILNRNYGEYEGGLLLEYLSARGHYHLRSVWGVGANFYDMN